ncbi:hypothetical protein [Microbulbifer mangrovi]|uniref:hypothetical protein n=1 Tax=Microbulbifer mangrovi TaxID=927787 RepID=UPI0009906C66|nr:hypothetical protein [Microbulbifer mangrovi]
MTISPEFAEVLRAGRLEFNTRVAEARRRYPKFDPELFNRFLTHNVDPIVAAANDECRVGITNATFDVALDLVGRELCGAHRRGLLLDKLWREVIPALTGILPPQPAPLVSALCNALLNLEAQGARPVQWLQILRELGPLASAEELTDIGLLAAWRSGGAQFRPAALRIAAALPAIAQAMLGLPETPALATQLSALESNPWALTPADSTSTIREIGKFNGYGGQFPAPPIVRACEQGFLVKSENRYFLLLVDSFGEALIPASVEEYVAASHYKAAVSHAPKLYDRYLRTPRGQFEHNFCHDDVQLAWNEHSVAVFSPYSFSIGVVPLT